MADVGTFSDDGSDPLLRTFLPVPRAELRLLGGFSLLLDGRPVSLPPGCERLLALLSLKGRTSRSRAAGYLWPQTREAKALACLRTCVWRCNRAAPGIISADSGRLELTPSVRTDVLQGGIADGELLPDWDDDWLLNEREQLREQRLQHLAATVDELIAAHRLESALEMAQKSLRIDPLREATHRAVITIHLAGNDRARAMRAYQRCRTVLMTELGVEPSLETTRLLDGIREQTTSQQPASVKVGP